MSGGFRDWASQLRHFKKGNYTSWKILAHARVKITGYPLESYSVRYLYRTVPGYSGIDSQSHVCTHYPDSESCVLITSLVTNSPSNQKLLVSCSRTLYQ
jgi:hypothetical protein